LALAVGATIQRGGGGGGSEAAVAAGVVGRSAARWQWQRGGSMVGVAAPRRRRQLCGSEARNDATISQLLGREGTVEPRTSEVECIFQLGVV